MRQKPEEIDKIIAFEMKMKRRCIRNINKGGNIFLGCEECNWENTEKETIIGHIAQKHRWRVRGRVICPFCPRTYRNMANVKTHIKKGSCPNLKEEQQEVIWARIIEKNGNQEGNKIKSRNGGRNETIIQRES